MRNKCANIISTALCGMIFFTLPLNADCNSIDCPEKTHKVVGIERNLEFLRGSVYNATFTQVGGAFNGGDIIGVICPPLRPIQGPTVQGSEGLGFSTISSISFVDLTSQIRYAVAGTLPPSTPAGFIRAYTVTINVEFDCPFAKEPSVVASLENNGTTLATSTVAVGSFGLFVNNITTTGFSVDIVFEVYGDTIANINNVVAFVLTPAVDNGGGIAFNFVASAPK